MKLQGKFTYYKYILVIFNGVTVQLELIFVYVYKAVTVLFWRTTRSCITPCTASVDTQFNLLS